MTSNMRGIHKEYLRFLEENFQKQGKERPSKEDRAKKDKRKRLFIHIYILGRQIWQ